VWFALHFENFWAWCIGLVPQWQHVQHNPAIKKTLIKKQSTDSVECFFWRYRLYLYIYISICIYKYMYIYIYYTFFWW
jgi:hypothetical protein